LICVIQAVRFTQGCKQRTILTETTARVRCKPFQTNEHGVPVLAMHKATHILDISRSNAKFKAVRILETRCCAPEWETWGSHEPDGTHVLIADPRVVIEAIVHRIDVTSGREAIHCPDTMHKLHKDIVQYTQFLEARSLTKDDMLN
jgi:hypothetical protein